MTRRDNSFENRSVVTIHHRTEILGCIERRERRPHCTDRVHVSQHVRQLGARLVCVHADGSPGCRP